MSDTALLVRDDSALSVVITAHAGELKTNALESASLIRKVETATQQELAVSVQSEIKALLKLVEDSRTEAKAPILDYGRAIDTAAKNFVAELKTADRNARQQALRAAVNTTIQGSAADLIKLAMVALGRRLKESGSAARMTLQVHDELLLEVPEKELPRVARLVRGREGDVPAVAGAQLNGTVPGIRLLGLRGRFRFSPSDFDHADTRAAQHAEILGVRGQDGHGSR